MPTVASSAEVPEDSDGPVESGQKGLSEAVLEIL